MSLGRMRFLFTFGLYVIAATALAACQPQPDPVATLAVPAPTSAPDTAYGSDSNIVLVVGGDVQLMRPSWKEYHPISLAATVHRGDLLQLAAGATATVLCDDLSSWAVPTGGPQGVSNGCSPPGRPDLVRDNGVRLGPARNVTAEVPYSLSPRRTNIMTPRPLLRWQSVANATSYTVRLQSNNRRVIWEQTVTGTEVQYSGPPLVSGVVYSFVVKTVDGQFSEDETTPLLGFRLLTGEEMARVAALVGRVDALSLPDEARSLALAHIYRSQNLGGLALIADAIQQVEQLLQQEVQSPALYQLLGDLYRDIDLPHEARAAYEKALDLATSTKDIPGQAAALAELGQLLNLGQCEERRAAPERLQQAAARYEALGDLERRDEVMTWMPTNPPRVCPTATPGP